MSKLTEKIEETFMTSGRKMFLKTSQRRAPHKRSTFACIKTESLSMTNDIKNNLE
jgi:hypothetical protein